MSRLDCLLGGFLAALGLITMSLGAEPVATPESGPPAAPKASMVVMCPNRPTPILVWVILPDGHIIRFDKEHRPATAEGIKLFIEWVKTGPVDVVVLPECPLEV
jgi:hypothetical protein